MTENLNPNLWGPHYWATYHCYAQTYPNKPTPIIKDAARAFIKVIPFTLPCATCSDHAYFFIKNAFVNDPNLNQTVSSKKEMVKFFKAFHNDVNKRLGKPSKS